MTLLVTAFEPFGPWDHNSTVDVAEKLSYELGAATLTLPVDIVSAPQLLRSTIRAIGPTAVLALGLHGRTRSVRVERAALNVADFSLADNAGRVVHSQPVVEGAPDGRLTSANVREVVNTMRADGVPADVSNSAGTYLCNAIYFVALDALAEDGCDAGALFLHLPPLPGAASKAALELKAMRARGEGPARVDPRLTGEAGGVDEGAGMLLDLQVRGACIAARHLLHGERL